jgi:hypothetical protein
MKYLLAIVQLAFGLGLFLSATLPAYPHGGGLDGYGCHHNRKAGGYHVTEGRSPVSPSRRRTKPSSILQSCQTAPET